MAFSAAQARHGQLFVVLMTSLGLVIPAASCNREHDSLTDSIAPSDPEPTTSVAALDTEVPSEQTLLTAAHVRASQDDAEASYRLEGVGDGGVAEAGNHRQRFAVRAHTDHVEVRVDEEAVELDLVGYGRTDAVRPVAAPEARALDGHRFSYEVDGVREWYVHGPWGLEQGFDLPSAPPGHGLVTIAIDVGGDFVASPTEDGAVLTAPSGAELKYTHLVATDADGQPLPVALAATEHRIVLQIDDAAARYPIVVDPLVWTEIDKTPGEASNDQFGDAVAIDGDTAVVGAPFSNGGAGALYIYVQQGQSWALEQKIVGPSGDHLGWRVAIDGDDIISARSNGSDGKGVRIYHRTSGAWAQQLATSSTAGSTSCGFSVDIDGDTAAFGCPKIDGPAFDAGRIQVYTRSGNSWSSQVTLNSGETSGTGGDRFGHSVALDGDRLIGGGPAAGPSNAGAVYEFTRAGVLWTAGDRLIPSDGASGYGFGTSVSLDHPHVAVGAPVPTAAPPVRVRSTCTTTMAPRLGTSRS